VVRILIDASKCSGCCMCEIACSLEHTGVVNPRRSRIRVFREGDFMFPIIAGPNTEAGCNSQHIILLDGEKLDGCVLCRASCPMKPIFREPETDIPIKCDFCGEPPDPKCVEVCLTGALSLIETK
jgi:Fe-S-cluster-containing dehydrogenase component